MTFLGKLRKSFMGSLPPEVAALTQGTTRAEQHLGKIFLTVVQCYQSTLFDSKLETLVPRLNAVDTELRGFVYEGAGMGLMQLDCMLPWKKRLQAFLAGAGSPYLYPAYIGAGLALARLHRQPEQVLAQLDPVLGWFVIDGYGFRHGIFARRASLEEKVVPEHLSSYARCVFDQGLGRSLWFANGADAARIAAIIATFPAVRQVDLWSGVGFACAYAGGADRPTIQSLQIASGSYRSQLALGAAIGAKGRERSGNLAPHTELACEILCGLSDDMAAHITDIALQKLPIDSKEPAHKIWRQRIQAQFAVQETDSEISSSIHSLR